MNEKLITRIWIILSILKDNVQKYSNDNDTKLSV